MSNTEAAERTFFRQNALDTLRQLSPLQIKETRWALRVVRQQRREARRQSRRDRATAFAAASAAASAAAPERTDKELELEDYIREAAEECLRGDFPSEQEWQEEQEQPGEEEQEDQEPPEELFEDYIFNAITPEWDGMNADYFHGHVDV